MPNSLKEDVFDNEHASKTLSLNKTIYLRIWRGLQDEMLIFVLIFFVYFSFCKVSDERDFGPWSRWSACSQYCGSAGVTYRVRSCIRDGDCQGQTLQMSTCYKTKCYCKFWFMAIIERNVVYHGCLPCVRIKQVAETVNNGKVLMFSKISKPTEQYGAHHLQFNFP